MITRTFKSKLAPALLPPSLPAGCTSVEIMTSEAAGRWLCEGEARITADGKYYGTWRSSSATLADQSWLGPELIDWDFVREREANGKKFGDMRISKGVLVVDLWYPRNAKNEKEDRPIDHPTAIEVGLSDVRAADSIRIEYDFGRDGYVIKQASKFWFEMDEVCDPDWQEVAFVQAWGREVEEPEG